MLNETKSFSVSILKHGLYDACFVYRHFLHTLKTQGILDNTARDYAVHLSNVDIIIQQYRKRNSEAKKEWAKENPHIVVLAFEYARKLGVPHLGYETTESFCSSKKALDVSLLRIVN